MLKRNRLVSQGYLPDELLSSRVNAVQDWCSNCNCFSFGKIKSLVENFTVYIPLENLALDIN